MTQRQLNKLVKIKKILKVRQDEKIPQIMKDYCINGIVPKNKKILEISNDIKNMLEDQKQIGIFPRMPSDKWMVKHGTIAPPYDEPTNSKENDQ